MLLVPEHINTLLHTQSVHTYTSTSHWDPGCAGFENIRSVRVMILCIATFSRSHKDVVVVVVVVVVAVVAVHFGALT